MKKYDLPVRRIEMQKEKQDTGTDRSKLIWSGQFEEEKKD